jgi:phosphorylcholine metabolism protein LicD
MGEHPFTTNRNRFNSAKFLNTLMNTNQKMQIVAGGGTALGFCRDFDFIKWDNDFDLFASIYYKEEIIKLLKSLNSFGFLDEEDIYGEFKLSVDELVPFRIKFFDPKKNFYKDVYEDHIWEWPTEMFSNSKNIEIYGFNLKVPNPPDKYLKGVYGKFWYVPNPKFAYDDYGKF